jgi:hypothetical protein
LLSTRLLVLFGDMVERTAKAGGVAGGEVEIECVAHWPGA